MLKCTCKNVARQGAQGAAPVAHEHAHIPTAEDFTVHRKTVFLSRLALSADHLQCIDHAGAVLAALKPHMEQAGSYTGANMDDVAPDRSAHNPG